MIHAVERARRECKGQTETATSRAYLSPRMVAHVDGGCQAKSTRPRGYKMSQPKVGARESAGVVTSAEPRAAKYTNSRCLPEAGTLTATSCLPSALVCEGLKRLFASLELDSRWPPARLAKRRWLRWRASWESIAPRCAARDPKFAGEFPGEYAVQLCGRTRGSR